MTRQNQGSVKIPVIVWAVAVGMTVTSLLAAGATEGTATANILGIVPVMVIMIAGLIKAWLILQYYLEMRFSTGSWRGLFMAFLIVIGGGVVAAQALLLLLGRA
ncbi:cytochrome C oxidase subunit IV family protein [Thalassospira sp.]|uniref:cytochrome C oxidase subunit IV family protein n=1 Tax=Thalassospira sp. TaxID=1912094 RepID=UPI002735C344|nr:cytochrome C oxidase subunit IV family protein [Thalassospira sp.]MDP2698446.1 cytochrome C oxidase subunit IV family protein [Thalassospira sp.]